jgi:hypothetical protein
MDQNTLSLMCVVDYREQQLFFNLLANLLESNQFVAYFKVVAFPDIPEPWTWIILPNHPSHGKKNPRIYPIILSRKNQTFIKLITFEAK